MTKCCTNCRMEKPLSDFPLWKRRGKEERSAQCYDCRRTYHRSERGSQLEKSRRSAYRSNNQNFLAAEKRRRAKRARLHPEKERARVAVHHALATGKIVRPITCERCGNSPAPTKIGASRIQAHHDDYSRPLDVKWLCVSCHNREHNPVLMRELDAPDLEENPT